MSWHDEMDRDMDAHPEWFGMTIDDHGNPTPDKEKEMATRITISHNLEWKSDIRTSSFEVENAKYSGGKLDEDKTIESILEAVKKELQYLYGRTT